ncbi:MAG TPA: hypothetical protein VFM53_11235 [Anaeromyxobacteraceae bacterium]|nr:hypothetical protein [Anaeromyxobacteraceae bacterium]
MSGFATGGRLLAAVLASVALAPAALGSDTILEFDTMAAVDRPYTGSANAIRGVNGGGLPWIIDSGKGEVKADGRVEVKVRGLVLADDPAVPAARRLTNPFATFSVVVSCLSRDAGGAAATVNVSAGGFPATPTGDAKIEAAVDLPRPCIAPIVFVTSPTGAWFAATGN